MIAHFDETGEFPTPFRVENLWPATDEVVAVSALDLPAGEWPRQEIRGYFPPEVSS